MPASPPREARPEDEDPLDALLTRVLLAPARDRPAELERACAEHPDLSSELRRRAEALDALGLWSADEQPCEELPAQLGDFRPLERLGAGGMGVVFRAAQVSLGREVALKLVRPDYLYFPLARERFRREVEAAARLRHPGIVPVYAVGEERGLPYFAMELVEGCTLAEVLDELRGSEPAALGGADLALAVSRRTGVRPRALEEAFGRRSWVDACIEIARRVAEALQHAHARSILHRDVKPSNLMLDVEGRVMLLDFGLASGAEGERTTRTGSQLGTLHYMSPEQVRGEALDARADVYSLGAVLYECLTLRPPFQGATALAIQQRILSGDVRPARAVNRRVGRDADRVCGMALEVARERRYSSAELFARDLWNVLGRGPVLARPPSPLRSASRFARRHPTASVGLGLGLLLATGIPTALYWQQRAHSGQLEESLGREQTARQAESAANRLLEQSLASEREARSEESRAREDAESTLQILGNVLLDATPERLQGRPLVVEDILERGAADLPALADSPGVQRVYLRVLGDAFRSVGRFDRAIELLRQATELERATGSGRSWPLVLALNSLGTSLQMRGRLGEAVAAFEQALEVCDESMPGGRAGIALLHNNLGGALYQLREHARALEHQQAALDLYLESTPVDDVQVCTARCNLALLLLEMGRREEAREHAEMGLELARAPERLDASARAQSFNSIAIVYARLGRAQVAEDLRREAIDLLREVHERGDVFLALALYNLGQQLSDQGRQDEALELLDESVRMMDELGLADHPNAALFRSALDAVARQQATR